MILIDCDCATAKCISWENQFSFMKALEKFVFSQLKIKNQNELLQFSSCAAGSHAGRHCLRSKCNNSKLKGNTLWVAWA